MANDFFTGGEGVEVAGSVLTASHVASHALRVRDYVLRGGPLLTRGGLLGTRGFLRVRLPRAAIRRLRLERSPGG